MRVNKGGVRAKPLGGLAVMIACAAIGAFAAGCSTHQVDKYTVSDADRQAGSAVPAQDKNALPGGTMAATPEDLNKGTQGRAGGKAP